MSFFTLKEKLDAQIYQVFNLVSDLIFSVSPNIRHALAKNRHLLNRHDGKRAFILGTGPSLAGIDPKHIQKLSEEYLFGVNSLYKARVFEILRPQYYVLMDNNFWGASSHAFQDITNAYEKNPPTFITDLRARPYVPANVTAMYLYAKHYPVKGVRCDLSSNLSVTMNVVSSAILSAIYMGFKEIYLLGCDYNLFAQRTNAHCYDDSAESAELQQYNLAFYLKYYHLTTEFHYLISKLARSRGVKILNLTSNSLLDAYPQDSIETVLG